VGEQLQDPVETVQRCHLLLLLLLLLLQELLPLELLP
jgi:hypothetical protein